MCQFITLVAPTDDVAALRAVLGRHSRAAEPIENSSVRNVLQEDERQYLTARGHCDCGTVLSRRPPSQEAQQEKREKDTVRMRRKGWSHAKIVRAIEGQHKAEARRETAGPDTLELWNAILHELRDELKLTHVGLLVRSYSGALASESFEASRRQISKGARFLDALASIEEDEVTIFPFR